jgi:hypothetical protein
MYSHFAAAGPLQQHVFQARSIAIGEPDRPMSPVATSAAEAVLALLDLEVANCPA